MIEQKLLLEGNFIFCKKRKFFQKEILKKFYKKNSWREIRNNFYNKKNPEVDVLNFKNKRVFHKKKLQIFFSTKISYRHLPNPKKSNFSVAMR